MCSVKTTDTLNSCQVVAWEKTNKLILSLCWIVDIEIVHNTPFCTNCPSNYLSPPSIQPYSKLILIIHEIKFISQSRQFLIELCVFCVMQSLSCKRLRYGFSVGWCWPMHRHTVFVECFVDYQVTLSWAYRRIALILACPLTYRHRPPTQQLDTRRGSLCSHAQQCWPIP
jgi:hypothetical protein